MLCTAAVSLFGNLFLYYRMNTMLLQKADSINAIHLATLSSQLNGYLEDLSDLGNLGANDLQVVSALEWRGNSTAAMKQALNAQNRLNAYLASSPIGDAVYQITALNTDGRMISGVGITMGTSQDYQLIVEQPAFRQMSQQAPQKGAMIYITPSIHRSGGQNPYVVAPERCMDGVM